MTTTPKKRSTRRAVRAADIIRDLIDSASDLAALSQRHFTDSGSGGAVQRLAAWYDKPETAALLGALRRLADERADLVVAHARSTGARRMIALALDTDNTDSARKACFDLLKLSGGTPRPAMKNTPVGEARNAPTDPPPDPDSIRQLYDRIAEEIGLKEAEVDRSGEEVGA